MKHHPIAQPKVRSQPTAEIHATLAEREDQALDEALEESFPASDPVAISTSREQRVPPNRKRIASSR